MEISRYLFFPPTETCLFEVPGKVEVKTPLIISFNRVSDDDFIRKHDPTGLVTLF